MTAAQVASLLSITEFQRMCGCIDMKTKAGESVLAGDTEPVRLAGKLIERRFKVITLERQANKIRAFLDLGKGHCLWVEFKPDVKAQRAA